MIEPVFEELAHQKTHGQDGGRLAFVKVDMAMGSGGQVGAEWGVRVTPTFLFFLDGKKQHELKGVNAPELRTQVDLLLYQAFPRMCFHLCGRESVLMEVTQHTLTRSFPSLLSRRSR